MFDGTLGKYSVYNYTIKVKEDTKPYHAKPYHVKHVLMLNIHKPKLKKEVHRLIKTRVLKKINNS